MNYIDCVKATREITGMQGTGPASIASAVGTEAILTRFVKESYIDIQNLRPHFDFLSAKHTFSTTVGKTNYKLSDIFTTGTENLKEYDKDSFFISINGKKTKLRYMDREELEAAYLNSTQQRPPSLYSIDYADNSLILQPASDGLYTVSLRYWRTPEILTTDAQVPIMPVSFHLLIVYRAVEKMAIYMNSQAAYSWYSREATRMIGQLMRAQLRPLRMKTGALA